MPIAPDELTWPRILAVLIGQADGEVFVPHSAVVAVKPYRLEIEKSLDRDGWFVRLQPALIDGSECGPVGRQSPADPHPTSSP